MPVKIKQLQTKKTEWVSYNDYCRYEDNNLYKTLVIKDIYELYNRKSGVELWQATLEKQNAIDALNKHPDIFRIEYSDKNTKRYFFNLSDLLLNNKLFIYIKKYTIKAGIKIRNAIVAIALLLVSCYLSSGSHFDDLIKLIRKFFNK